jgi:hypothetical protein
VAPEWLALFVEGRVRTYWSDVNNLFEAGRGFPGGPMIMADR